MQAYNKFLLIDFKGTMDGANYDPLLLVFLFRIRDTNIARRWAVNCFVCFYCLLLFWCGGFGMSDENEGNLCFDLTFRLFTLVDASFCKANVEWLLLSSSWYALHFYEFCETYAQIVLTQYTCLHHICILIVDLLGVIFNALSCQQTGLLK